MHAGGLTFAVAQEHKDLFSHLALMSPFPSFSGSDWDPKTVINSGFKKPPNVLILTAGLDVLACAFLIKLNIEMPLRLESKDTYTFLFGKRVFGVHSFF